MDAKAWVGQDMNAEEIDYQIGSKRWSAYPLLVQAVKDLVDSFAQIDPQERHYDQVDRAVALLVILGEKKIK